MNPPHITRLFLFLLLSLSVKSCFAASSTDAAPRDTPMRAAAQSGMLANSQHSQSGGIYYPKPLNWRTAFTLNEHPLPTVSAIQTNDKTFSDWLQMWEQQWFDRRPKASGEQTILQQETIETYRQTKECRHKRLLLRIEAARANAQQEVYDNMLDIEIGRMGLPRDIALASLNALLIQQRQEDFSRRFARLVDARAAQNEVAVDPSAARHSTNALYKYVISPYLSFYNRHEKTINAVAKSLVILSAAAFIFDKFGGTRWLKRKIDEVFNKPKVYHVKRRRGGPFGKKAKDLVHEDDLVLSHNVRKQVSELIYLIRRRCELRKTTKRRFALPMVLLHGPPGTGKTMIAQMIADQTIGDNGKPMSFIKLMASDFVQIKNEGDRVAVLKDMFKKARNMKNVVIFLDEIDAMTRQRGQDGEESSRAFLDHLLDETVKPSSDFMVIAATNHKNRVDNAFVDRCHRKIKIDLPTKRQRVAIIEQYVKRELVAHGYSALFDVERVAGLMLSTSGRQIESFVLRMRDRLDFHGQVKATESVADQILREMGLLPALSEDEELALLDAETIFGEPEGDS